MGATEYTILGPFHRTDTPEIPLSSNLAGDLSGEPVVVRGRMLAQDGRPIPNASDANASVLLQADAYIEFDPQGYIYVRAEDVGGEMIDQALTFDAELLVLFGDPVGLEGGVTLHNVETPLATVNKSDAVFGFSMYNSGQVNTLYVGGGLDLGMYVAGLGTINVGGQTLYGHLDPSSPVLTEYEDLFDDMDAAPGTIIKGAYLSLCANNIPVRAGRPVLWHRHRRGWVDQTHRLIRVNADLT